MKKVPGPRPLLTAGVALLATLGTASVAQAAAVTVTGDDGNPVALTAGAPAGIRNMSPSVAVGFLPTADTKYSTTFSGPDGIAVSGTVNCYSTKVPITRTLDYRGNGSYTVVVTNFAKADRDCATPLSTETYGFVINGAVAVGAPAGPHLIRAANDYATRVLSLPVQLNPGSNSYEIRYAAGGVIGADGAISGPSDTTFVSTTTGLADFRLKTPGIYTVVARAAGYSSGGKFFTPWSAPIQITAVTPFDLLSLRFPDSRGPKYVLKGTLRETSIRGRVSIAMARGKKGGKYRSLGRVKISSKGTFSKRFTQRRTGVYRVRISYRGSRTTAKGTIVQSFRISRRLAF